LHNIELARAAALLNAALAAAVASEEDAEETSKPAYMTQVSWGSS